MGKASGISNTSNGNLLSIFHITASTCLSVTLLIISSSSLFIFKCHVSLTLPGYHLVTTLLFFLRQIVTEAYQEYSSKNSWVQFGNVYLVFLVRRTSLSMCRAFRKTLPQNSQILFLPLIGFRNQYMLVLNDYICNETK